MQSLTIRHVTTYRYRQPVAFGEHRMMLRPRDLHDQKVIAARLGITPEPASLRYVEDAFGNHVAIAKFDARATELSFESVVSVERPLATGTGSGVPGLPGGPSDLAVLPAASSPPIPPTRSQAGRGNSCPQRSRSTRSSSSPA